MGGDFRINLAKEMTSSPEERARFYTGMLIYLVLCFIGLTAVGYFGSINIQHAIENHQKQTLLVQTASSVSGVSADAFHNPDALFQQLEDQAFDIAKLKKALGQQVRLLPVIQNLFADLPAGVSLQSLTASKQTMAFGLVMPPSSDDVGDPVALLSAAWESNEELTKRIASIRPIKGERRSVGTTSIFYVQFECVLRK